jgi:calcineurin-like phosphoesterase family protein
MIYFTADLHLGHTNIIAHTNRPFATVEEMDEVLLNNWNAKVQKNDTVYIVGDLFFYKSYPIEESLQAMNGKKHLIIGNHDKNWMKKVDLSKHFESVELMAEISDGSHAITLCHYPMMTWNRFSQGEYLIYGHIHNNRNDSYWPLLSTMDNALNAGVEINNYEPVTFDELVENNRKYKES